MKSNTTYSVTVSDGDTTISVNTKDAAELNRILNLAGVVDDLDQDDYMPEPDEEMALLPPPLPPAPAMPRLPVATNYNPLLPDDECDDECDDEPSIEFYKPTDVDPDSCDLENDPDFCMDDYAEEMEEALSYAAKTQNDSLRKWRPGAALNELEDEDECDQHLGYNEVDENADFDFGIENDSHAYQVVGNRNASKRGGNWPLRMTNRYGDNPIEETRQSKRMDKLSESEKSKLLEMSQLTGNFDKNFVNALSKIRGGMINALTESEIAEIAGTFINMLDEDVSVLKAFHSAFNDLNQKEVESTYSEYLDEAVFDTSEFYRRFGKEPSEVTASRRWAFRVNESIKHFDGTWDEIKYHVKKYSDSNKNIGVISVIG